MNAKDMYAEELSERFRYFKETEGGMGEMCKVVEERAKEYAADALQKEKVADIRRMLDKQKYSHEEIAENFQIANDNPKSSASQTIAQSMYKQCLKTASKNQTIPLLIVCDLALNFRFSRR